MYIHDLGIKEINQYYAQHGGRRNALIKGFANYMENAKTGRISAHTSSRITAHASSRITAHASSASAANTANAGNSSKTGINTRTARQTAFGSTAQAARQTTSGTTAQSSSKAQSDTEATGNSTAGNSRSQDYCCDKCQLTQQLMLRMMTNNLYTQSGLGYSAMGSGALAAYQSLSKYFGTGLFS